MTLAVKPGLFVVRAATPLTDMRPQGNILTALKPAAPAPTAAARPQAPKPMGAPAYYKPGLNASPLPAKATAEEKAPTTAITAGARDWAQRADTESKLAGAASEGGSATRLTDTLIDPFRGAGAQSASYVLFGALLGYAFGGGTGAAIGATIGLAVRSGEQYERKDTGR